MYILFSIEMSLDFTEMQYNDVTGKAIENPFYKVFTMRTSS